jgi:hypothetical protein
MSLRLPLLVLLLWLLLMRWVLLALRLCSLLPLPRRVHRLIPLLPLPPLLLSVCTLRLVPIVRMPNRF